MKIDLVADTLRIPHEKRICQNLFLHTNITPDSNFKRLTKASNTNISNRTTSWENMQIRLMYHTISTD